MNAAETWTIGRLLTWSADYLAGRRLSESPRLDAEVLLAHALGMQRIQLYTHFDKPLSGAEREPFKGFLKRRGAGEPVAYITGEKEFMGLAFKVGPEVLIPRPDTEVLVETVLALLAGVDRQQAVLDVGTGSGCIAIALALKAPRTRLCAWDIDEKALMLAAGNAARLGARVELAHGDALDPKTWERGEAFDLIVSNPPYIAPDEAPQLALSVAHYEPAGALFAAPDGLAFYRALAAGAPKRLSLEGCIAVEIGSSQAAAVTALFAAAGWREVQVKKDYAKLDRVVTARRPSP
jgi:release factor glutamine methyltransferase